MPRFAGFYCAERPPTTCDELAYPYSTGFDKLMRRSDPIVARDGSQGLTTLGVHKVMEVACSTHCFTREPFENALRHIADLEFGKVEIAVVEGSPHITPEAVIQDVNQVVRRIRQAPSIGFAAVSARLTGTGESWSQKFDAVCRLAAQLAAPLVVIDASPVGTPLDDEIARLARFTRAASLHGAVLTITTKTGTVTEDPNATVALCEAIPGLGLTLDPSHYICGPHQGKSFDQVYPHVRHVHLRDSGRRMDQLQVQVGRGEIEYSKVVASLQRFGFKGALAVDIEDAGDTALDVEAEVRKLRLLLESLL